MCALPIGWQRRAGHCRPPCDAWMRARSCGGTGWASLPRQGRRRPRSLSSRWLGLAWVSPALLRCASSLSDRNGACDAVPPAPSPALQGFLLRTPPEDEALALHWLRLQDSVASPIVWTLFGTGFFLLAIFVNTMVSLCFGSGVPHSAAGVVTAAVGLATLIGVAQALRIAGENGAISSKDEGGELGGLQEQWFSNVKFTDDQKVRLQQLWQQWNEPGGICEQSRALRQGNSENLQNLQENLRNLQPLEDLLTAGVSPQAFFPGSRGAHGSSGTDVAGGAATGGGGGCSTDANGTGAGHKSGGCSSSAGGGGGSGGSGAGGRDLEQGQQEQVPSQQQPGGTRSQPDSHAANASGSSGGDANSSGSGGAQQTSPRMKKADLDVALWKIQQQRLLGLLMLEWDEEKSASAKQRWLWPHSHRRMQKQCQQQLSRLVRQLSPEARTKLVKDLQERPDLLPERRHLLRLLEEQPPLQPPEEGGAGAAAGAGSAAAAAASSAGKPAAAAASSAGRPAAAAARSAGRPAGEQQALQQPAQQAEQQAEQQAQQEKEQRFLLVQLLVLQHCPEQDERQQHNPGLIQRCWQAITRFIHQRVNWDEQDQLQLQKDMSLLLLQREIAAEQKKRWRQQQPEAGEGQSEGTGEHATSAGEAGMVPAAESPNHDQLLRLLTGAIEGLLAKEDAASLPSGHQQR